MATSWTLNAGQLITQAYSMLGQTSSGGAPTAFEFTTGIIALNAMLKGWQLDGVNLWRQQNLTVNIPAGAGVPGNPVSIEGITNVEFASLLVSPEPNFNRRPLGIISYIDYQSYPTPFSGTTPSSLMYDRQENSMDLYLFPAATQSQTVFLTCGRTVNDVENPTDPVDLPSFAIEAAIYNLADRLMNYQGLASADPATAENITQRAVALYGKLLNYDRPDFVMIRPFGKKGSGPFWRS